MVPIATAGPKNDAPATTPMVSIIAANAASPIIGAATASNHKTYTPTKNGYLRLDWNGATSNLPNVTVWLKLNGKQVFVGIMFNTVFVSKGTLIEIAGTGSYALNGYFYPCKK